jgi:hypothetical protein
VTADPGSGRGPHELAGAVRAGRALRSVARAGRIGPPSRRLLLTGVSMTRPLLSALAAAVVLSAGFAQDKPAAKKDDPIAEELSKAKGEFLAALDKAKEKLLTAFAEEAKRLADNTTLKVDDKFKKQDQLRDEKKAFEEGGKLPKSAGLKAAVSDYQTKLTAAKNKCEKAFDAAAKKYDGKKDAVTARAVLKEKTKLFQATGVAPDERSYWVGKDVTFTQGANGVWTERGKNGVFFRFKESDRTREYVEITDPGRGLTIRLSDSKTVIKGEDGPWHPHNEGGWEQPKK